MTDAKKFDGRRDQLVLPPLPPCPPPTTSLYSPVSQRETSTNTTNINIILSELRIRSRNQPQQHSEWWSIPLSPNEYENLLALIQENKDLQGVK
jgi:hypothetical protein